MAKDQDPKTKVRPLNSPSNAKAKKLSELQKAIDAGVYKISSHDIAKAYLYKANAEFNTFSYEKDKSKEQVKVKKSLKSLK